MRTVVLLCRNTSEDGSFGFILNKPSGYTLDDAIDGADGAAYEIFAGGPVSKDTLHYIHTCPQFFTDCEEIAEGIFWGGDFEILKDLINRKEIAPHQIRFFLGYSGWSAGQLTEEMTAHSWLVTSANIEIVFNASPQESWKAAVCQLGEKFKMMLNFPTDPQLN